MLLLLMLVESPLGLMSFFLLNLGKRGLKLTFLLSISRD
jgi:hypothetical protein